MHSIKEIQLKYNMQMIYQIFGTFMARTPPDDVQAEAAEDRRKGRPYRQICEIQDY